jgi:protein-tyrosine phosphatase
MPSLLNHPEPVLLVLCTGNVCRSPMAEALFMHHVAECFVHAKVISRGLAAPTGRSPHQYAISVSKEHGVPIDGAKRASMVTSADMAAATAVFVMDATHRREIQQRFPTATGKFPTATGKTFLLGQWQSQEIPDPINEPVEKFEQIWHQIDAGARAWVSRLKETGILSQICEA